MIKIEYSVYINRPHQQVFDFVSNPANDPQWVGPVESAKLVSEGPVGVGSILSSEAKFMGRNLESTSEYTVWDPPNQFALKSVGGPISYEQTVTFNAKDTGTQLNLSIQADVGGFFKLAEGLVGKQLNKQVETDFITLKSLLEAE